MRKQTFVVASVIFLVVCFLLYNSLETASLKKKEYYERGKAELGRLESRLKVLEQDLQKNEQLIGEIKGKIYNFVGGLSDLQPTAAKTAAVVAEKADEKHEPQEQGALARPPNLEHRGVVLAEADCMATQSRRGVTSDVQMLNVYDHLAFDNHDGGVWKQGWEITYDKAELETRKPRLHVVLVPHSHCDPGWIKTFEKYYSDQTRRILDGMVAKLTAEPTMKFIYAEMSFFERWWQDIDEDKRKAVRKLTENGQFEIVTGAWVMTDEANSHYFASIEQMIEGHQWLEHHLSYKPKNHWSIDPFGLSSTMAYLLKQAQMDAMVIQRVHYSVKKHLAQNKQLEFMWRQLWHGDRNNSDILTHMFPFYSYDVPHTCGPNPKICCQFDFKRLPGGGVGCPWNVPPEPITTSNVEQKAALLLDQYRKKAQLYNSNVLLVPLGDDFRYDTDQEWNHQFDNYKRLFDFINAKTEWNTEAHFGTLHDYFTLLHQDKQSQPGQKPKDFPILSGDFFTYADRDDHYWSGYFTSRPFYKRLDRMLQHHLRAAEIAYSFTLGATTRSGATSFPSKDLFQKLTIARRNLGLFQHHDGVTGTAKDHVVVDYGIRMWNSLQGCKQVIAACTHFLLATDRGKFHADNDALLLNVNEHMKNHDAAPERTLIRVSKEPKSLVLYNSLTVELTEVLCVNVDSRSVKLTSRASKSDIAIQINPVITTPSEDQLSVDPTAFELCFEATVPPLGFTVLELATAATAAQNAELAANFKITAASNFDTVAELGASFELSNWQYSAQFDGKSGFLKSVNVLSSTEGEPATRVELDLQFVQYGARGHATNGRNRAGDSLSGAYLFLPDGNANALPVDDNRVLVVKGSLISYVFVKLKGVLHRVRLSHVNSFDAQSLTISNLVDITQQQSNYELAMRLKTSVKSGDIFYTDLNGFQMVERRRFAKIPLQGNFYPMPSGMFVEDADVRVTLLSAQPLGAASLESGWLEVILDRRLTQDDDRGLFQGVTDNKATPDHFKLVVEPRAQKRSTDGKPDVVSHHTLTSHFASLSLNYPVVTMHQTDAAKADNVLLPSLSLGRSFDAGCDVHLVNLRTLEQPRDYAHQYGATTALPQHRHALILQRVGVDCSSGMAPLVACVAGGGGGKVSLSGLGSDQSCTVSDAVETSLTLMYELSTLTKPSYSITLEPMQLRTFKVTLG